MTKKQLAALQRILEREAAAYRALSGRPAPGQHPSEDKFAISDGNICILLNEPLPNFPMGERVDSLARIVWDERKSEAHYAGEIIEIDDGLKPYFFYVLSYGTVIPLPYFQKPKT